MTEEHISLKSQLLVAMPNLHDPSFDHTVTLICVNDEAGSFGLTVNRPLGIRVGDIFEQLELNSENDEVNHRMAFLGGPVESGQGFVLHDSDKSWESTLRIDEHLAVTSSRDILEDIVLGDGPDNFLLTLGCANWAPQQLEDELMANAWLTCPSQNNILFELPYEQRWQAAASSLGVDISRMSHTVGHA